MKRPRRTWHRWTAWGSHHWEAIGNRMVCGCGANVRRHPAFYETERHLRVVPDSPGATK